MAKAARKTPHVKLAPKVVTKHLLFLAKVLEFIGKPVYLLLTNAILLFIVTSYSIGHVLRIFSEKGTKFAANINLRLVVLCIIVYAAIFIPVNFLMYIFAGLPSPATLSTRRLEVSTKIYDRHGVLLYKIYKDKNRSVVPLSKIPPVVRLATLAAEDAEFYDHPGISFRGILRAAARDVTRGELSGGSTITQQLVKNALLTPEKSLVRKVREVILAFQVEASFTKDQILEMYLNEVPYGGTAYGIQEAATSYFDKDVEDLTLAEAALLAGLPKRPSELSTTENALARQREILRLMEINGFITEEERNAALSEKINLRPKTAKIKAPHFVMYVRDYLEKKYGLATVDSGGLEVTTTLDYEIQRLAEQVLETELQKVKSLKVGNGGVLVLNPQTGEILAMVGSRNYFDLANDGNVNVTLSPRSPGSSIKIVNYSYALSNGYTAASIIDDSPITYRVPGQPDYSPKNYDGEYRGKISLRSALAESRNIPAVKILATYGVNKMVEQGKKMGITTWNDPSRFGLSLTLGGGETKLIDLATVYSTVATYGKRPPVSPIVRIADYKGSELEKNPCSESAPDCSYGQVLDPQVAYILIDILKDNKARAPAFGSHSQLVVENHPEVAAKTGTSNDLRDNLAVGFNQNYLVAVWVGNNDNTPMARIASGITGAAPIFNKIMSALLKQTSSVAWRVPPGIVQLPVCSITGTLACSNCSTGTEWFLETKRPVNICNPETVKRIREEEKPGGTGQI